MIPGTEVALVPPQGPVPDPAGLCKGAWWGAREEARGQVPTVRPTCQQGLHEGQELPASDCLLART